MQEYALALLGGLSIGVASSILLLMNGRVFGVSGIVAGIFRKRVDGRFWRIVVITGLMVGGWLSTFLSEGVVPVIDHSIPRLVFSGLLVGFGTQLAAGCTSGHGVCGISRRSFRSLVATLTFIAVGIATVALAKGG